jgi:hypothetical protein
VIVATSKEEDGLVGLES